MPSPPKTGTKLLHPRPRPPSVERLKRCFGQKKQLNLLSRIQPIFPGDPATRTCIRRSTIASSVLLHYFLSTAFLVSAREPLTSAFDSARDQLSEGGGRVSFSTTSCRQPLSPQYRILLRLHKPQIAQLKSSHLLFAQEFWILIPQ